jgi:branched-chain amino acid transport system substrate-binding protein
MRKAFVIVMAITTFAAFFSLPRTADAQVKVGFIAPLTGPAAEAGTALRQGAQLAMDEINAKGGIDVGGTKQKLEVLFEDSSSKPEVGVSLGEKLITRDKIHVLVGEAFHSHVTLAVMELAPKYNIPVYSAEPVSGAIADKVKKDPKRYAMFWKGDFNSDAYAHAVFSSTMDLVKAGKFRPKAQTVAFVVEDTDYGRSNAADAAKLFTGAGWKVLTTETVPLGHTDFYPQFGKLRSLEPAVVITVFTGLASGVAYTKQYAEQGVTGLSIAVYHPIRPEFLPQAGKAAEGLLWVPLSFDPENLKHQQAFAVAIRDKFLKDRPGARANSDHASGYDAIYNIADTVQRARSLDPVKITNAFAKLDRKGLIGRYQFDVEGGHYAKAGPDFIPIPMAQIQNGRNVIVWPAGVKSGDYQPQPGLR